MLGTSCSSSSSSSSEMMYYSNAQKQLAGWMTTCLLQTSVEFLPPNSFKFFLSFSARFQLICCGDWGNDLRDGRGMIVIWLFAAAVVVSSFVACLAA